MRRRVFVHVIAAAVIALVGPPAGAVDLAPGPVRVVDGDTLRIGDETLRIMDIDAPERDQTCTDAAGRDYPCGARATAFVAALVEGRALRCESATRDRYGRALATCEVDGRDLGAATVRAGWALAATRFSDRYAGEERAAAEERTGMHEGTFLPPWTWRQVRREAERAEALARAPADPDCRIKGNVSRNGRLYHLPEWRSWPRTRIDEAKGERWFCSEAEARAAGWSPAFGD